MVYFVFAIFFVVVVFICDVCVFFYSICFVGLYWCSFFYLLVNLFPFCLCFGLIFFVICLV